MTDEEANLGPIELNDEDLDLVAGGFSFNFQSIDQFFQTVQTGGVSNVSQSATVTQG